jgi:mannosyltransferase PIG-V
LPSSAYVAYEEAQRIARVRAVGLSAGARESLRIALLTRAATFAIAFLASLNFSVRAQGLAGRNARLHDVLGVTHPFRGFPDLLLAPLARWDAVWYLSIAGTGYNHIRAREAFFPLYPLLVRALGELGGALPGALLCASYVVSLATFAAALVLLHQLVELELGRPLATPTLLLLALFPASFFFGAPYSESLFLLVSVGAFYAARTGHWGWAGMLAAAASATRNTGILLVVPLIAIYIWGPRPDRPSERPRYVLRRDAAWLLLAPLGLIAYCGYLGVAHGDAFGFMDAQTGWFRHFAGPGVGAWDGIVAGFHGARQLVSGPGAHVVFPAASDPFQEAALNLMLLGFLVFAVVTTAGVLRRLPRAYGIYVVISLLLPLSYPANGQPLMSLPRFLAVLFPLFMWVALVSERRRITPLVAAMFALGLGFLVTQFATWQWVA